MENVSVVLFCLFWVDVMLWCCVWKKIKNVDNKKDSYPIVKRPGVNALQNAFETFWECYLNPIAQTTSIQDQIYIRFAETHLGSQV